jgi:hypothetical protein
LAQDAKGFAKRVDFAAAGSEKFTGFIAECFCNIYLVKIYCIIRIDGMGAPVPMID